MANYLMDIVRAQKSGHARGIYSVCSSEPTVLRAACRQAVEDGLPVLIEATSNQVDQYGGYTGLTPSRFRDFVQGIAAEEHLAKEWLILGGDHLGPNRWQSKRADEAMVEARALVAAYVDAGFTKIHLDCSFVCADDPTPMSDEVAAERAADLLAVAEDRASRVGLTGRINYVIGTEVPVPGGHQSELGVLEPTSADAARATIAAHKDAFKRHGLSGLWPQIVGLVVQPAVEFDHLGVVDYQSARTVELRGVLDDEPSLVFEAHSTDYQTEGCLSELVADHWAILKVGPGLTFALREGLFGLSYIEDILVDTKHRSNFRDVVDKVMLSDPIYWEKYYQGSTEEQKIARAFSYSDRLRYYWPNGRLRDARETLVSNLRKIGIPMPLLSQFLPRQYLRIREGKLANDPIEIVIDKVRDAMRPYAKATVLH